jgi:hypothetical protein
MYQDTAHLYAHAWHESCQNILVLSPRAHNSHLTSAVKGLESMIVCCRTVLRLRIYKLIQDDTVC